MTKIEAYNHAKEVRNELADLKRMNGDPAKYDKFGAEVRLKNTYSGVYGHSGTQPWTANQSAYVQQALNSLLRTAIDHAYTTSIARCEAARKNAQDEARDVLIELAAQGDRAQ